MRLEICGECSGSERELVPGQEHKSQKEILRELRSEMSGLRERQRRSFLRKVRALKLDAGLQVEADEFLRTEAALAWLRRQQQSEDE